MVWGDEWKGIMEWIVGDHSAQLGAPLTRRIFEECDDYACAKGHLTETELVSPVYFILANGAAPGKPRLKCNVSLSIPLLRGRGHYSRSSKC